MFYYLFLLSTGIDHLKICVTAESLEGGSQCSNEWVRSSVAIKWYAPLFGASPLHWVLPFLPGVPSCSPWTLKLLSTSEVIRDYQQLEVTSVFAAQWEHSALWVTSPSITQSSLSVSFSQLRIKSTQETWYMPDSPSLTVFPGLIVNLLLHL